MKTEQLQREGDLLKTKNDTMKDENKQLTNLLENMSVTNESQVQQFNVMSCEMETMKDNLRQLKSENQQLKVSQYSDHMSHSISCSYICNHVNFSQ